MDISNKLKTLRVQKNITPEIIAEKLNISVNTYRKYERNEAVPNLNILSKIARIYEITIIDLLKENVSFNKNIEYKGNNLNTEAIHQLSDKIIQQYELRIKEKDEIIMEQKQIISKFKNDSKR